MGRLITITNIATKKAKWKLVVERVIKLELQGFMEKGLPKK